MDMIPVLIAAAIVLILVSMVISVHNSNEKEREHLRSNAMVLREYRRIAIYRPHYIIDNQPRKRNNK